MSSKQQGMGMIVHLTTVNKPYTTYYIEKPYNLIFSPLNKIFLNDELI